MNFFIQLLIVSLVGFLFYTYINSRITEIIISNKTTFLSFQVGIFFFVIFLAHRIIGSSINPPFYTALFCIVLLYGLSANYKNDSEFAELIEKTSTKLIKASLIGSFLGYLTYIGVLGN